MKLLALTPHPCNIQDDAGVIHTADRIETEPGRFLVLRADTIINSTKAVGNFTAKSKSFGKLVWVTVDKDGKDEQPITQMSEALVNNVEDKVLGSNLIIVSMIALNAIKEHGFWSKYVSSKCYAPGDLLRGENGQPIGCVGLTYL